MTRDTLKSRGEVRAFLMREGAPMLFVDPPNIRLASVFFALGIVEKCELLQLGALTDPPAAGRYVCCYLLRKNYPLLLPTLDQNGVLSYAEAATVASVFETVVGIVKFFCGVRQPQPPPWWQARGGCAQLWELTGVGTHLAAGLC